MGMALVAAPRVSGTMAVARVPFTLPTDGDFFSARSESLAHTTIRISINTVAFFLVSYRIS
jgi:hypothetical protein